MYKVLAAAVTLLLAHCGASPLVALERRQSSCPDVHVFGARETTAPAGYGSSSTVVNFVLNAYPGSTAEAISYPAWSVFNQHFRYPLKLIMKQWWSIFLRRSEL
jgi:hypothetical protein